MTGTGSSGVVIAPIKARTALSKSGLSDYVVNPYLGCQHSCRYCYVQRYFRSKLKPPREWGSEIYVRVNMPELVCREAQRKAPGRVLLSSMTDAYQPIESHNRLTRGILQCLVDSRFPVTILTKSNLVLRDLDLLTLRGDSEVTFSVSSMDRDVCRAFEPYASPPETRMDALREVLDAGVKGELFVAPHIPSAEPFEAQYKPIFERAAELHLAELTFDFLNYRSVMRNRIALTYERYYPQGTAAFSRMLSDPGSYRQAWKDAVQSLGHDHGIKVSFV
jgi:DNA repair photolyase